MSDDGPRTRRAATKKDFPPEEPKKAKKVKAPKQEPEYDAQQLQDIAHQLRIHSIEMTAASKSGHPTSCSSMAELISVLFFTKVGMHYNPKDPKNFGNDRFVLSKGHAAPILYAAWSIAGFIDPAELLRLRQFDSELEGHPTPRYQFVQQFFSLFLLKLRLPFVDVATGSLGQGLSVAGGMAYSSKYLDKINNRYWVLIGDGESAEGSIWEAAHLSSYYKLDNLTLIVDINRLGQSQETSLAHDVETYKKRFEAFGWQTYTVDGHNIPKVYEAFEKARNFKGKPTVILAKTFKGKYLEGVEDKLNFHGTALPLTHVDHLKTLQKNNTFVVNPVEPEQLDWPTHEQFHLEVDYASDAKISTRKAYGKALVALSKSDANRQIVSLDGDTKNSTFALTYKEAVPSNFVEGFIAEQNVVGWAQGLACRGKVAFTSAFGCFFTRAYDQIRMGGISHSYVKFVGSHSGVSIGEDGPSQMALEDFAMFRSIPGSVVLYPSDGVSAERAIELVANEKACCYVRTSRPDFSILYGNHDKFEIGKSKVVQRGKSIVIVAGGVTLHEALKVANQLDATVIDIFSIKPVDRQTLLEEVQNVTSKTILTVEDHYLQGGIFEAVSSALADQTDIKIFGQGVTHVPRSGSPSALLAHYKIDSEGILNRAKELL